VSAKPTGWKARATKKRGSIGFHGTAHFRRESLAQFMQRRRSIIAALVFATGCKMIAAAAPASVVSHHQTTQP
jgi:hypothetical protein